MTAQLKFPLEINVDDGTLFSKKNHKILFQSLISKRFQFGTVVKQACPFLNGRSLENTLIFPLRSL